MPDPLLILILAALAVLIVLCVLLLKRTPGMAADATGARIEAVSAGLDRLERTLRDELAQNRSESGAGARQAREETAASLASFGEGLASRLTGIATQQKEQLDSFAQQIRGLTESTEDRFERLREAVESRLRLLQEDNSRKLDQMRATVDEKLSATLEQRLGQSFRLVSERLEQVHKGLGEMQSLASGVGDLKRVLTNVKSRGTWGEIQLGTILEQVLTPEQYMVNVATRSGSSDRVEYAIRLPGRDPAADGPVLLPVDAKFPQEDYQRLLDAQEQANPTMAEEAGKQLEVRIRTEARAIRDKYLDPPHTTDFGIMFLPTEGLYAEVLRRPGLADTLQREYRVTIAGPTTLAAILNSLQMGFRTLAIERRSSEVWTLLAAVKTEFSRFGELLDKTQKKLQEASNSIETAASKSRTIERKLRRVQVLPAHDSIAELPAGPEDDEPASP